MALGWLWRRAWVLWCGCLRGRRGTWRHRPSLCVAGVALGDIDLHFAWQVWHLVTWTCTLWAGLALMALDWLWWRAWELWSPRLFVWQAWHLATLTFTLCGRRGAYGTGLAPVAHKTLPPFHTHTQLCHTQLFDTHNFVTHNSFTHNSFTHGFVTYNSFTHNTFTYTNLHTQHCHTQLFHPTCLAPSPL